MKKDIFVLILLVAFVFTFTNCVQAQRSTIAGIVEFQTIDIGGFWIGGQLNPSANIEIPGKHFQPDRISLHFLKKTKGYDGWQIRGSFDYDMNKNFYNGYGLGVTKIEDFNLVVGTAKTPGEVQKEVEKIINEYKSKVDLKK